MWFVIIVNRPMNRPRRAVNMTVYIAKPMVRQIQTEPKPQNSNGAAATTAVAVPLPPMVKLA